MMSLPISAQQRGLSLAGMGVVLRIVHVGKRPSSGAKRALKQMKLAWTGTTYTVAAQVGKAEGGGLADPRCIDPRPWGRNWDCPVDLGR